MTLLNYADSLRIGGVTPSAVYLGATKVWQFKPTDLSGCAVWMDATKLNLTQGATVSSWTNLGSGSQPTITGTPTFQVNALNGRPVVRITQQAGKLRWYSGTGVDKDWTLVYVGRVWKATTGRVVTALFTASNLLVGFHGSPTHQMDQCYIEGWLTSGSYPTATTAWKLYSADSTSSAAARFFVNGVSSGSVLPTPAKGWGNTLAISGAADDALLANSQECDCEIAELVLYNRRLSDAERQQVESYLRLKWLAPVASFNPNNIYTDLVGWFNGADAGSIFTAGSGVTSWANRGSGSVVLNQSTTTYMPTYANQTITFNEGQGFAAGGSPTAYDVIWVGRPKPSSVANWRTLFRSSTGNPTDSHQVIIELNTTRIGVYYGGFFPAGGLTWDNVYGIGYGRFSNAAPAMLSRDGGVLTSTGTTIASTPFVSFGAYQGPPPSQAWGDIREIIFLPYNYQDSTRQQLEGYLAWKWGLTGLLPAGHPYKSVAP